jgi:integrase/recombinase XerD
MKIYRATEDFKLNGVVYAGFPIIVDSAMELVWDVHQFLVYYCLTRGRVQSKNSWWRYAQDIYDYFGFLENAGLSWKTSMTNSQYSVIAAYRDWSLNSGLSPRTINNRLRVIIKFYEFAVKQEWITELPFNMETVHARKKKTFYSHISRRPGTRLSPDVLLKEQVKQLQILTEQEIKTVLEYRTFISHNLIYRLALQTGLRKSEILSLPNNYIQDPKRFLGNACVRVKLDPIEMKTKGAKERYVDMPIQLYERLWQYKIHDRNQLLVKNDGIEQKELFLNRYGKPFSPKGSILNAVLKKITGRNEISLHKLRHTFATFKLHYLRQSERYRGDPLIYVQDRLGHTSILTTQVYLHYLDILEGDIITQYDEDIDHINSEILDTV